MRSRLILVAVLLAVATTAWAAEQFLVEDWSSQPVGSTGAETRSEIAADIPKWAKVIQDAHIKPAN